MSFDGKTPTVAFDNDITPTVANRCSCGQELVFIDGDEKPPMTPEEINVQFHCLMSRRGDWFFCIEQAATWIRVATG